MVLNGFTRYFDRFLRTLDAEGVGIFQAIVYIHFAMGATYCGLAAGGVPDSVRDGLGGGPIDTTWMWAAVGSMICLVGKVLSARGDRRLYWVHTTGLWLQFAGDSCAFGAFWGYVIATASTTTWGTPIIGAFVFAALGDCAALLMLRDIRRWQQAERALRKAKAGVS